MKRAATALASFPVVAQEHMPQIRLLARQQARGRSHLCGHRDLVYEGLLGLWRAYRRYDPAWRVQFWSYAEPAVLGAMRDVYRGALRNPAGRIRQRRRALAEATETQVSGILLRAATADEVCQALGWTPRAYAEAIRPVRCLSLDATAPHHEDEVGREAWTLLHTLPDQAPALEAQALRRDLWRRVQAALGRLPTRAREVIRLYYDEGLSMRDIGGELGCSESRVCQLHGRAVQLLRAQLARRGGAP